VRVFESIVTEFEDIVCFAMEGRGALALFSGIGIAMSDSYSDEMGRGSLNEASGLNNLGGRPGPVHIAMPRVIMPSMPECFRAGIGCAREVGRIEEHLRSD
jgi:hypothetical protein